MTTEYANEGLVLNGHVIQVGATFRDESHNDTFTIVGIEGDSVDLDNGQWYELFGPEGLIAKLDAGIVKSVTT